MACDNQGSSRVITDLRLFVAPTASALLKSADIQYVASWVIDVYASSLLLWAMIHW